ncbi:MAG: ABC transporter permease [Eubacteriales bacterium]|nr:ABC transporter permease [Eubacteriales bacterium]MDD4323298.1 ABC transporter permease [Eubacteriales bacterium]
MKINEIRYATQSGFRNLGRHPFLLIASVITLTLMLFILSIFVAFSLNATHLSKIAAQQPPITISMRVEADDSSIVQMRQFLASHPEQVVEYEEFTPEMNFESFKSDIGKEDLWEDFSVEANIPYTFNVRLSDPGLGEEFKSSVEGMPEVYEVLMESEVMNLLDRITLWTNRVGLIIFIVLSVISALIVSNMIRVAVLSRSNEINIMKYLGATKGFIELPFVIEGLVAGLMGALLASLTSGLLYAYLQGRFDTGLRGVSDGVFTLLPNSRVIGIITAINLLVSFVLCLVASVLSVRKHAKV